MLPRYALAPRAPFSALRETNNTSGLRNKLQGATVITNINIHHAVVGKLIATFGGCVASDLGPVLPPSQLPPCDVLQLDCEGAEVGILREMMIQPRVILVETHGLLGAPTHLVASLLKKHGYVVADRGVAEPSMAEYCTKYDIRVLIGITRRE